MKPNNINSWKCERIAKAFATHNPPMYAYYHYGFVRVEEGPEPIYVRHSRAKTKFVNKFATEIAKFTMS